MKTFKEYNSYLINNGYTLEDTLTSDNKNIYYYKSKNGIVTLEVENNEVIGIKISSHLTTKLESYTKSPNYIFLGDEYPLSLFPDCLTAEMNKFDHEFFIISQHYLNLTWIRENLISLLAKYKYRVVYSSTFDICEGKEDSNLAIQFKREGSRILDPGIWLMTDCLTGKLILILNSIKFYDKGTFVSLLKDYLEHEQRALHRYLS